MREVAYDCEVKISGIVRVTVQARDDGEAKVKAEELMLHSALTVAYERPDGSGIYEADDPEYEVLDAAVHHEDREGF